MAEWFVYGSIIFMGAILYTVWSEQSNLDKNMANLIAELRRRVQEAENRVDLLAQKYEDVREELDEMIGGDDEQST